MARTGRRTGNTEAVMSCHAVTARHGLNTNSPLTLRDTNPALNESSKKVTHRQLSQTAHKGGRSRRTTSLQLHNYNLLQWPPSRNLLSMLLFIQRRVRRTPPNSSNTSLTFIVAEQAKALPAGSARWTRAVERVRVLTTNHDLLLFNRLLYPRPGHGAPQRVPRGHRGRPIRWDAREGEDGTPRRLRWTRRG